MRAVLTGGPVDGEIREVGDPPPDHIDVEVPVEGDDNVVPIPPGVEYPETEFENHRYVLDNVDGNPRAAEPRAKYSWRHRLP